MDIILVLEMIEGWSIHLRPCKQAHRSASLAACGNSHSVAEKQSSRRNWGYPNLQTQTGGAL